MFEPRPLPRFAPCLCLALALAGVCLPAQRAQAGGLYLMPRGTQPVARGGAFVAGADNPHALWYNPAGLTESGRQLVFDMTLPMVRTEFTRLDEDGQYAPTVKAPSAPLPIPTLAFTHDFGLEDWGFGLGLMVPAAYAAQWPENVELEGEQRPAPQRYSILDAQGTAFGSVLLGAAYSPLPWLSLGVSASLSIAQVGARAAVSTCDYVLCSQPEAPEWEAQTQFLLKPQVLFGAIFGITLRFEVVRLGASVSVPSFGKGPAIEGVGQFDIALPDNVLFDDVTVEGRRARVAADLPVIARFGLQVQPLPALRVELGGTWQQWSAQDEIAVEPLSVVVHDVPSLGDVEAQPVSLERNMRNTVSLNLGFDYTLVDLFPGQRDFVISGGAMVERGAFDDAWLTPVSPDSDKLMLSVGLGLQLNAQLWLDATFGHLFMRDRTVTDSQVLLPTVLRPEPGGPGAEGYEAGDQPRIGNGRYAMEASFVGAGIRYQFRGEH